jgi:hypothetical protein
MYELVGALHIHSNFSDGSGTVKEIVQFANEAGLDYIILTDHNTLRALHEGFEGWHDNTLLLVGCEINDKENKNHLLAFGVNEAYSTRLPALEYTRRVKEAGGLGFLAHPHEKRNSMKEHPPYPWTEWESEDFTGIEIWNHMSEWMEGLTEQNKYNYFMHPLKSISSPPRETIEVWDKLNLKRRVVGIGGVDAHAHRVNLLGFFEVEVFPYKVLFKSIRTHILSEKEIRPSQDPQAFLEAKIAVYNSLRNGRCFISNHHQGDAKGFRFFARSAGFTWQMGDLLPLSKNLHLNVEVPAKSEIRILRNGEVIVTAEGEDFSQKVEEPGAYRVEVYIDGNAWIFSNHIRIGL